MYSSDTVSIYVVVRNTETKKGLRKHDSFCAHNGKRYKLTSAANPNNISKKSSPSKNRSLPIYLHVVGTDGSSKHLSSVRTMVIG